MTTVVWRRHLPGARRATGPTVVIDVFRAFSTAAYLLAGGVERLLLAAETDEARRWGAHHPGSLLVGEERGRRPPDFDFGNSPAEVAAADVSGATVVLRTSAGTRAVVAAVQAGAAPVYAASLVVAGATARALGGRPRVTVVPAGDEGRVPAAEDEACGSLIEARLLGRSVEIETVRRTARDGSGGQRLASAPWAHPDDLDRCLDVDRFGFAMEAVVEEPSIALRIRHAR